MSQSNPYFSDADQPLQEIGDLLRKLPADFTVKAVNKKLNDNDLLVADAIKSHSSNSMEVVSEGIGAIGNVLFLAAHHEEGQSKHISNLGLLIQHLSEELQFYRKINEEMQFVIHQSRKTDN